jgi:histidine kinase/DNA gyrase B/HSP90-like ATPase
MTIPPLLAAVLERDSRLHGVVLTSLGRFEEWITKSGVVFFAEYSDHGPAHIETVMRSAAGLIPPQTWASREGELGSAARTPQLEGAFTSADAATLVLAILLHDAAMHLTKDGFLRIIDRGSPWNGRSSELGLAPREEPWPDLWAKYLTQCSRYDEQQLQMLFGDSTRVERPPANHERWDGLTLKWIGEFVRRHHARLAHEIALNGVPGPGTKRIELPGAEDFAPWMRDVAGLVARSHNMDLRAAVDWLPARSRKVFRGVHVPYLMALVRIADYLDLDAARAPAELANVRGLRSPLSRREWDKHKATVYVTRDEDDPEGLWIDAQPEDLHTFLGLRALFAALQHELDLSWAVLGETYREDPAFGVQIRRVRSTLDDPSSMRLPFVPSEARLRTTGAGLLNLLVGPLYNDQAAYGIRELAQNAIDACLELDDARAHGAAVQGGAQQIDADVVIAVEEEADGTGRVTVEDRGIGMTPDVVRDYFLVAGASFRDSDAWHETHTGLDGQPRIARAGRFGVGVMAAFLLGDTVEVTTRDARQPEDRGIGFSCRIGDPVVEMRWKRCPYGTTIRVRVTQSKVFDQLADAESWDWYRLATPTLRRSLLLRLPGGRDRRGVLRRSSEKPPQNLPLGTPVALDSMETVPAPGEPVPPYWRLLDAGEWRALWTYRYRYPVTPDDVCNGFVLRRPDAYRVGLQKLWPQTREPAPLYLYRPRLSVIDRLGQLPIDLRRTAITRLPFERELSEAVCREAIATLITLAASTRRDVFWQLHASFGQRRESVEPDSLPSLYHPAVSTSPDEHRTKAPGSHSVSWLGLAKDGLTLCTLTGDARVFIIDERRPGRAGASGIDRVLNDIPEDAFIRIILGGAEGFLRSNLRESSGGAMLIPHARWQVSGLLPDVLKTTDAGNGWRLVRSGQHPDLPVDTLTRSEAQPDDPAVVFLPASKHSTDQAFDPLTQGWLDLLGVAAIPLDLTERRTVLQRAFVELRPEIERLERESSGSPEIAG